MVTTKEFGKQKDGKVITLYCITNSNGYEADVMNYGANLVNLFVPDANGAKRDIVLGYDNLEDYTDNGNFFGATVGPLANRTANAEFTLGEKTYKLDVNDNNNNLHSHKEKGLHKAYWEAEIAEAGDAVTFTAGMKDGEIGFPGNRTFHVTYTLTEQNELKISYEADSDAETIINMTNHSYFNLSGHDSGSIGHTRVKIKADRYTYVDKEAIPTGELPSVQNTPMDFTDFHQIGERIEEDFEQLKNVGGYDHNYVIQKETDGMEKVAEAVDDNSGICMEVFTDLPGIQLYVGNGISPLKGKNGAMYDRRAGFCFETQYFPNSANEPNFAKPVFGLDKPYKTETIYKFSIK